MKRLNTRLNDIERQAGTGDGALSLAENTLLVQCLGRRDSLFWPTRWTMQAQPPMCEIRQRQREYLQGTSGVSARADGRSQWKSAHEIRQSLVTAGMLQAVGSNGETVSVLLTGRGEAVARQLVGDRLATLADAAVSLLILRTMIEHHGSPIRESILFCRECTGNPEDWNGRVELFLPLLTSGVARTDSDTQGRILYSLVDGVELPESIAVTVEPEDCFDEIYIQTFNAERATLTTVEPRDPAAVYVPIGASSCWPKSGENTDEK